MPSIFYSWQSDRPNQTNRNLIKRSLEDAIEILNANGSIDIEDAIRLDHDTRGIPGSPAIVDTILQKIESCDVFVPDVSFVTNNEGRLCPNPNVMIEYGYALKSIGPEKILAVMNTHFGEPVELPFDMRHRRFPLSYNIAPDADVLTRQHIRQQLTTDLRNAIEAILAHRPVAPTVPPPPFERRNSFDHGAIFEPVNQLFPMVRGTTQTDMRFPEGPKMFLRLMPREAVLAMGRSEALDVLENTDLWPLGSSRYKAWGTATNRLGVCQLALHPRDDSLIGAITQLHLNQEIWGVENYILTYSEVREKAGFGNVIPDALVKRIFTEALERYLRFASQCLLLPLPYVVIAGLVNIEGYTISLEHNQVSAPILDRTIIREFLIEDVTTAPNELLRPFFSALYDAVGIRY